MTEEPATVLITELGRFLTIAHALGRPIEMFSPIVDREWHRLIEKGDYPAYCDELKVPHFAHDPDFTSLNIGKITWAREYEIRFGKLSKLWFLDRDSNLDKCSYQRYISTGEIWASWDCGPVMPEGGRVPDIPASDVISPDETVPPSIPVKSPSDEETSVNNDGNVSITRSTAE